jgi:succinate dehydrogenase hydrophobic anchor subunit
MPDLWKLKMKWTAVLILLTLLLIMLTSEAHELSHAEICTKFGGTVAFSGWSFSEMNFVTICMISDNDFHKLAQSEVESFGYQMMSFLFGIMFIIFALGYLLIWMKETEPANIRGKRLEGD